MLGGSLSRVGDAANGSGSSDGGSSGGGSSGGSGSRVNDKPWAIMFARLKRPSATSRVRVHGSSSCREKKKREESVVQGVGLVYSPAQRRAKTKRRTPTSHDDGPLFRFLSFSLSLFPCLSLSLFFSPSPPPLSHQSSRDGFSPNAAETRKPASQTSVI